MGMKPATFPPPVLTGSGSTGSHHCVSAPVKVRPEVRLDIADWLAVARGQILAGSNGC